MGAVRNFEISEVSQAQYHAGSITGELSLFAEKILVARTVVDIKVCTRREQDITTLSHH